MPGGALHLAGDEIVIPSADPRGVQGQVYASFASTESLLGALVLHDFRFKGLYRPGQFLRPVLNASVEFIVGFPELPAFLALRLSHKTDQRGDAEQQDQTAGIDFVQPEAGNRHQRKTDHRDETRDRAGPVAAKPGRREDGD